MPESRLNLRGLKCPLPALKTRKAEIYPTLNGKVLRRLYGVLPRATVRSSRILLTKSWKDVVLNRYSR